MGLFSEVVCHGAVAEGLVVVVGIQVVFIILQWCRVLDLGFAREVSCDAGEVGATADGLPTTADGLPSFPGFGDGE
jgi:hypothetical protein